jgi:poly(hydroxyalkanoate) granule-associated protein
MAQRKGARGRHTTSAAGQAGNAVADSAQKIWLAGLGAFERAKSEGPKMFDTLVEQGRTLGGKAREAADDAMKRVRDGAGGAGGHFDKFEQAVEERVTNSLRRMGVLTRGEVGDLSKQVRDLSENVRELMRRNGKSAGSAKRRAASKVSATKRKAKGAVSSVKRSAAQRTRAKKRSARR